MDPSLSDLVTCPPEENVGTATIHAPVSQVPSSGEPPPTKSSGTPNSGQKYLETREISTDLGRVVNPSRKSLSNKSRTPSGTGNPNCDYLVSIVHDMCSPHQRPPYSLNVGYPPKGATHSPVDGGVTPHQQPSYGPNTRCSPNGPDLWSGREAHRRTRRGNTTCYLSFRF